MAWEPWPVGGLLLDNRGFPIPVRKHMLPAFPDVSCKVKLALQCISAHALEAGLHDMHWQGVTFSYAWDPDTFLLPYLMPVYGPVDLGGTVGGICWGGDFLSYDILSMERADCVITGQPCLSFSSIGLMGAALGSAELVFRKVTDCIVHQGSLGCYGFILETVPWIASNSRPPKGNQAEAYCFIYYEEWMCVLQRRAPIFR